MEPIDRRGARKQVELFPCSRFRSTRTYRPLDDDFLFPPHAPRVCAGQTLSGQSGQHTAQRGNSIVDRHDQPLHEPEAVGGRTPLGRRRLSCGCRSGEPDDLAPPDARRAPLEKRARIDCPPRVRPPGALGRLGAPRAEDRRGALLFSPRPLLDRAAARPRTGTRLRRPGDLPHRHSGRLLPLPHPSSATGRLRAAFARLRAAFARRGGAFGTPPDLQPFRAASGAPDRAERAAIAPLVYRCSWSDRCGALRVRFRHAGHGASAEGGDLRPGRRARG